MTEINLSQVLGVIQKAVKSVDDMLIEHTEDVTYIMWKILKKMKMYEEEEIIDLCIISLFHDIGVYKVEDREITEYELVNECKHAVYGYLFIKNFSPLSNLAEVILGHHLDEETYNKVNKELNIPEEALILELSDYISMCVRCNNNFKEEYILENNRYKFLGKYLKYFMEADNEENIIEKIITEEYKEEVLALFKEKILTEEEIINYIRMLTYIIDFRSEATVMHTITVESISKEIARRMKMNTNDVQIIGVSAMLHDVGKIAIPVEILEKPGKLTVEEMEVMKSHAQITYNILSDLGIDHIRDIAALHHEKLDGSGYPYGLKSEEISMKARIVAVADIVSALIGVRTYKLPLKKEKVIEILFNMAKENKIDKEITNLVIKQYDEIKKNAFKENKETWNTYKEIKNKYKVLLEYFKEKGAINR